MTFVLGIIITHEGLFAFAQHHPIRILHGSSITSTFFLLLHLHIKLGGIYLQPILTTNKLCQVEREAVSVEQTECLCTVEHGFSLGFQALHLVVKHRNTLFERAKERVFLFFHHATDKFALGFQLGIGLAHLVDEGGQQLKHEGRTLLQEGVGVTNGAAKDTTNNVSSLGIARQLTIGDGESHSPEVVGNHTHSHIHFLVGAIFQTRKTRNLLYHGLEDIGVVVRCLTL